MFNITQSYTTVSTPGLGKWGSAADLAGLMAGDIIVQFGDDEITALKDLQEALCYYKKGQTINVTVERRDKYGEYAPITVEVTLQEKPEQ